MQKISLLNETCYTGRLRNGYRKLHKKEVLTGLNKIAREDLRLGGCLVAESHLGKVPSQTLTLCIPAASTLQI